MVIGLVAAVVIWIKKRSASAATGAATVPPNDIQSSASELPAK